MNTSALNHLAGVIGRAMRARKTPMGVAMAVDAAGMLQSPETAAEHERLRGEVDEVQRRYTFDTAELKKRVAELEAVRVAESSSKLAALLAPSELTVFRASHDSIPMGLYTTRQAAYEHCEAHEMRDDPVFPMFWRVDPDDGVAELFRDRVPRCPGAAAATGYVVTTLTVASAYDGEADE